MRTRLWFLLAAAILLVAMCSWNIIKGKLGRIATEPAGIGYFPMLEVLGEESNHLTSSILLEKTRDDWSVEIRFTPTTNFAQDTWLLPTSPFNAKLVLWGSNGKEFPLRDRARRAMELADKTTVSNSWRNIDLSRRGAKNVLGIAGLYFQVSDFGLRSAFDFPLNQDVVLQIAPVMYRPLPNQEHIEFTRQIVQLVEFPPIRVKLESNGNVEQLKWQR